MLVLRAKDKIRILRGDVESSLETVVRHLKQFEKQMLVMVSQLEARLQNSSDALLKADLESLDRKLETSNKKIVTSFDKLQKEFNQQKKLWRIARDGDPGSDGAPGKDADEKRVEDSVFGRLSPKLEVINVLREDIEKLYEELDEIRAMKKEEASKSIFVGGVNPYQNTTILSASGTVDASNKDFAFAFKPTLVVVNGTSYREDKGWAWTAATSTATLDVAPGVGGDVYGIV